MAATRQRLDTVRAAAFTAVCESPNLTKHGTATKDGRGVFVTLPRRYQFSTTARAMDPKAITDLIENGLPGAKVVVSSDDNTHFEALVIAEAFAGKRPLARHQLVYGCLGSLMGNEIHAMSIRAHTPEEWRAQNGAE